MEREKQIIEEMANEICANNGTEFCASGRCSHQWDCPLNYSALEILYNAGYRKVDNGCTIKMQGESELSKVLNELLEENTYVKQRQGEWIINKSTVEVDIYCKNCNYQYTEADPNNFELYRYCPNCGSHMKGTE